MHFVILENMLLNDCFNTTVRTNALTLVMETRKGHGKRRGKSWNFKIFKEYEPCVNKNNNIM